MTSEIQALISEMREAAILTGQSGSTPIGYRVQQWADRLSTLLAATTPEVQALVTRLEDYYDFQCEGGPLKNCVEWQRLKEAAAALVQQAQRPLQDAEEVARRFHEAYERLAPQFSYETREASRVPWNDVPEQNRRLMIAVCAEVLGDLQAQLVRVTAERDEAIAEKTRAVLRATFKGYQAGENTDSKHWRERAEAAEAALAKVTVERDHERHERETVADTMTAYAEWSQRSRKAAEIALAKTTVELDDLATHHKNLKANEARVRDHYLARLEAAEAALSARVRDYNNVVEALKVADRKGDDAMTALSAHRETLKKIDQIPPHVFHETGQRQFIDRDVVMQLLAALASPRQERQEQEEGERQTLPSEKDAR